MAHTPRSDGQMHGQEVNVLPKNEAKKARGAEDTEEVVRTTERESQEFFQPIWEGYHLPHTKPVRENSNFRLTVLNNMT